MSQSRNTLRRYDRLRHGGHTPGWVSDYDDPTLPPLPRLTGRARRQQEILALKSKFPLSANQQKRLDQLLNLEEKEREKVKADQELKKYFV